MEIKVRAIRDICKYWEYMIYAAKSRLKAEVANSYLSWIWWVLEPFCYMLIYTVIFGYIFQSAEEYFPIYIFIGNTMWGFFSKTISSSVTMIRGNETIIAKVYLPKYVLVITEMMVNGFKMLVAFGLTAVMMVVFRVPVSIKLFWILPTMMVFFLITFGIATVLMHYGVYINDLAHVISIALNVVMYFTGIFFSIETRVPKPYSDILGIGNPVAFLLTSTRKAVIYNENPYVIVLFVWFVVAIVIDAIAINIIYKNENNYVKII